jgi:hypothetical protein
MRVLCYYTNGYADVRAWHEWGGGLLQYKQRCCAMLSVEPPQPRTSSTRLQLRLCNPHLLPLSLTMRDKRTALMTISRSLGCAFRPVTAQNS